MYINTKSKWPDSDVRIFFWKKFAHHATLHAPMARRAYTSALVTAQSFRVGMKPKITVRHHRTIFLLWAANVDGAFVGASDGAREPPANLMF